ncbi:MAG: hypothetical protein K9N35_00015 [Candidatus Marinimicrobia bacterium]|nr:hypothetical protein [Candidatus Neomarinimicrobiota bacterium]
MTELNQNKYSAKRGFGPWLMWVGFFSAVLVFVSLWIIHIPVWHIGISTLTLFALWYGSESPVKTLVSILLLVLFLACLQILFSPFMREMFFRSLNEGFSWTDWQYLLFAVERFAWPLMLVSILHRKLNSPIVASNMINLLAPLRWIGLKIDELQTLIILALRFVPTLQKEWNRFSYFQTYFSSRSTGNTLIQRLQYGQGILQAMIAHTIARAVNTGNLLALKGLPNRPQMQFDQHLFTSLMIWFPVGILAYLSSDILLFIWLCMSAWLSLTAAALQTRGDS